MAANTGRNSRVAQPGYISPYSQTMWTKREASNGKFLDAKTHGGSFKGVSFR